MLISLLKIAAVLFTVLVTIVTIVIIEYRLRYKGILKGFFHASAPVIKSKFSCNYMPFIKWGFWFNERAINEHSYRLNLTINIPWLAFDYTSIFHKL